MQSEMMVNCIAGVAIFQAIWVWESRHDSPPTFSWNLFRLDNLCKIYNLLIGQLFYSLEMDLFIGLESEQRSTRICQALL